VSHDADETILAALISGATWQTAAEAASCSRATVGRRMADKTFRARLAEARRAVVAATVTRLAAVAGRAVETLTDALEAEDATPRERREAAVALLTQGSRWLTVAEHVPYNVPEPLDVEEVLQRAQRYLDEAEEQEAARAARDDDARDRARARAADAYGDSTSGASPFGETFS